MFTEEQKKFFNDVIKPALVNMAIYNNLPSDINELSIHDFEMIQRAEEWYESLSEEDQTDVDMYVSHEDWHNMNLVYEEEISLYHLRK